MYACACIEPHLPLISFTNKNEKRGQNHKTRKVFKVNVKNKNPPDLTSDETIDKTSSQTLTETKSIRYHANETPNNTFGLLKKGIRISNINVCHLLNKIDEIDLLLKEKQSVDILGICETFLDHEIPDELVKLDGFNFERRDRVGKAGGGVITYLSETVNYKRRRDLENSDIETIWLEILVPNSKSFLYCSAYRPPSANTTWVDLFTTEINKATCGNTEVIISGDFNIDLTKEPPRYWSQALEVFNLTQVICSPTRVTGNSSTLIDHIYTNMPEYITELNVPKISMSDHYPVCITRSTKNSFKKKTHTTIEYRDYKKFDEVNFLQDLACINFDELEEFTEPNLALDHFYKFFISVLDKHAKIKSKRVKYQNIPKWINNEINEARHNRDFFHKKGDIENYKKWRNTVTELIRNAKRDYYRESIEENTCTSDIWKHLKEFTSNKNETNINFMTHNGTSSDDPNEIANMYNDFITNISNTLIDKNLRGTLEASHLIDFVHSKNPMNIKFTFNRISDEEVLDLLSKLNINKSAGTDNIGPKILKISAPVIFKPITYIINLSIATCTFPDRMKEAKITPIYKKGDKSIPGNYRPISILPTLSKIFEKHLASQIRNYLNEFDLLVKEQSGFREHHSCMSALTKMTENWLSEMDKGNLTGAVFLDFSKAFDLVNHEILIQKLQLYNFDYSSVHLLRSYLENRRQEVRLGKYTSNKTELIAGVPQGSVLGPLLFILFINDMPLVIKQSIIDIFADDATLQNSSNRIDEISKNLQTDVNCIQTWCTQNDMVLNETKTKSMVIGTKQRVSKLNSNLLLSINNKNIENSECEKLLGVFIDQNLDFDKHIDYVCKNVSTKIALLSKIKKFLPLQTRKLYYNAYILPVIDYCLTVWGSVPKFQLERLHKLQKRAARIILDMPLETPSLPLFEQLGWLNIYERLEYNKCILLYKTAHNLTPEYMHELFSFNTSENYSSRSSSNNDMYIKRHKTKIFEKSLQYSGPRLWNALPVSIRESNNVHQFKRKLMVLIISKRENV